MFGRELDEKKERKRNFTVNISEITSVLLISNVRV